MRILSILILAIILLIQGCPAPACAITKEDVLIVPHLGNRSDKRVAEIALCAIFRDEAAYLREWIEFHRLIGVSHFYLYNNLSIDHYIAVLQPYIENGIVELFHVPFDSNAYEDGAKTHNFVQVCCYDHALDLAKNTNEWLAIIDTDEFICPVKDRDLSSALVRYRYAGGLVLHWQIFGTSHVWELKPGELLIEKLLYKCPDNGGNGQAKSIVQPKHVVKCKNPHSCQYGAGKCAVMANHKKYHHLSPTGPLPVDVIRINHYTYRTDSFYQLVKKARRQKWGDRPSPLEEQLRLERANSTLDAAMLRFVPELKKRMFSL